MNTAATVPRLREIGLFMRVVSCERAWFESQRLSVPWAVGTLAGRPKPPRLRHPRAERERSGRADPRIHAVTSTVACIGADPHRCRRAEVAAWILGSAPRRNAPCFA